MNREFKIIVEKHADGYIAYPLGIKGVVVGKEDTYEEALADVRSAIKFHIETFGPGVFEAEPPVLEDLLKGITPENLHSEVDTGPAVGGEVWR
jgi:predicted RNase H-like HicB family nuclease